MATLKEVHLKIQYLADKWGHTPVNAVLQAFDNEPGISSQIEKLVSLSFIDMDPGKSIITLTLNGFFINIPDTDN